MKFLTPSLLVLTCFVIGGTVFKSMAPRTCGTILSDDTIFVLTGDMRRIPFAMRQLRKYPNADLYIIGAGENTTFDFSKRVTIESDSKSTYQNALAIREIANRTGLDRIVLITTEDHMNRAKYLIQREMPQSEIVTCPVPLSDMPVTKRLERWTVEYIKYIATMFGINEGYK